MISTGWDVGSGHHTTALEVLAVRKMTRDTIAERIDIGLSHTEEIDPQGGRKNMTLIREGIYMRTNYMDVKDMDICVKICDISKTSEVVDVTIGRIDIDLSHTEEIDPQGGKKNMTPFVP